MRMNCLLFALPALSGLFTSGDPAFAQDWTQTSAPNTNWTSVAASTDGAKLVAVAGAYSGFGGFSGIGPIYTSTNSGATWMQSSAPITNWQAVASSAKGTKLAAVAGGPYNSGPIFTSPNSGATWTATSAPTTNWTSVA